jgi:diacylglycerol kinase family enzyme
VWQIDGEQTAPIARMHVRVLPSALRIVVPPGALRAQAALG